MGEGSAYDAAAVVVTHQSVDFIEDTLRSVLADPGPSEIVVVDSASTDGTPGVVEGFGVRVVRLAENRGFAAAIREGFRSTTAPIVAVLNHDVTVHPGWLRPLVEALGDPDVGAAMATVELASSPGHFNTSGGVMTATAITWVSDYGRPIPEESDPVTVPFPSGAAFAITRKTWEAVDGMWDDLFLYHEDTDLGWRLRMRGLRSVRVPGSVVSHDYEFSRNPEKLGLLERNRLMMLLANYRRSTLLLLLPVIVLHELGVLILALLGGWAGKKTRGWSAVAGRRRAIRRRYQDLQSRRTVGDAPILDQARGRLQDIALPGMKAPPGAGLVSWLTGLWVSLIRPIVAAIDRRRGLIDVDPEGSS